MEINVKDVGEKERLSESSTIESSLSWLLFAMCGDKEHKQQVKIHQFISTLKNHGFRPLVDKRLRRVVTLLIINKSGLGENLYSEYNLHRYFSVDNILQHASPECADLIQRALIGKLVFLEFRRFTTDMERMFDKVAKVSEGENASYIPQMARIPRDVWAVSVCTVDGQRWSYGDSKRMMAIQSFSAALNYAIAVTEQGAKQVHKYVDCESCEKSNLICLDKKNLPHNPLLQSGALAITSLLLSTGTDLPTSSDEILGIYKEIAGTSSIQINNAIYIAEKSLSDRKFSIGYFMKEHGVFPEGVKLSAALELCFQLCSAEISCDNGSVFVATLANGGICPKTNKRVLSETAVKNLLSIMGCTPTQ